MALVLSLWIQLLLTLFFTNLVRWLSTALTAAEAFDDKLMAESQHHMAIEEMTRFAPVFRSVMLILWALLADGGRGAVLHAALDGLGLALPLLLSLILILNWVHVFVIYRERIMKLRQGVYFFNRRIYQEEYASFFIGYQVAGMTLSGFFFMAAGLVIALPLTVFLTIAFTSSSSVAYIVDSALRATPTLVWSIGSLLVTVVFQMIVNLCVFFSGPRGNKWLRYRFWYALYEYNMIFSNTLVGIAVMILRYLLWLVTGMFCLGRTDLTLLPGPGQLEFADFSYRCYISFLRQDHRYNNPVCLVFFDLMTEHVFALRQKRARRLLRRHFRLTWQLGVALSALRAPLGVEADRTQLRRNVSNFIHMREDELESERRQHRESHFLSQRCDSHLAAQRHDSREQRSHSFPAGCHAADSERIAQRSMSRGASCASVDVAAKCSFARPSRHASCRKSLRASCEPATPNTPNRLNHLSRRGSADGLGSPVQVIETAVQRLFDHSHQPVVEDQASTCSRRQSSVRFSLPRSPRGGPEEHTSILAGSAPSEPTHPYDDDDADPVPPANIGPFQALRRISSTIRSSLVTAKDDQRCVVDVRNSVAANLARVRARRGSVVLHDEEGLMGEPGTELTEEPPKPPQRHFRPDFRRVLSAAPPGMSALRGSPETSVRTLQGSPGQSTRSPGQSTQFPFCEDAGEQATSSAALRAGQLSDAHRSPDLPKDPPSPLPLRLSAGHVVHTFLDTPRGVVAPSHTAGRVVPSLASERAELVEDAQEFLSPLEALAAQQDYEEWRRRIVRNRWQLWWFLLKHPGLQSYRWHALDVMYRRRSELKTKAKEAKDRPRLQRLQRFVKHGLGGAAAQLRKARQRVLQEEEQYTTGIEEEHDECADYGECESEPSERSCGSVSSLSHDVTHSRQHFAV